MMDRKLIFTFIAMGIVFMFQLSGAALGLAVITTIFIDTSIN